MSTPACLYVTAARFFVIDGMLAMPGDVLDNRGVVEVHPVPERPSEPQFGLQGERFNTAVTALAVVFALGFAVVVAVAAVAEEEERFVAAVSASARDGRRSSARVVRLDEVPSRQAASPDPAGAGCR